MYTKVLKAQAKILKSQVKVLKAQVKVLKAQVKVLKAQVWTVKVFLGVITVKLLLEVRSSLAIAVVLVIVISALEQHQKTLMEVRIKQENAMLAQGQATYKMGIAFHVISTVLNAKHQH